MKTALLLLLGAVTASAGQQEKEGKALLRRRLSEPNFLMDPKSIEQKAEAYLHHDHDKPLRRKFISYTSSEWEKIWIDHVGECMFC